MFNLNVYREVQAWKKPVHITRALLAKNYLKLLPNLEVIGITGSVGKTLTQNAITSVLAQKYRVITGDENLDPTFRIPKTILAAKPWHQKMILEYGVEHPGDMDHYLEIVKPKIAVVTTIAPTHLKYLNSIEGVFEEKVKLVQSLNKNDYAVLNADDPQVVKMAGYTLAKIIWYGRQPGGPLARRAKNMIKISHFTQSLQGSKFRLHYNGQQAKVTWKVIGQHQLTSVWAAATVGIICGLTLKQIAKGLSLTKPPDHRLNLITKRNLTIIDDTYNASPLAARTAIATLISLGKNRQKVVVLGEMKDLGHYSDTAHKSLGEKIAQTKIKYLITVGRVAQKIATRARRKGFGGKVLEASSTAQAIKLVKRVVAKKSIILVKGSRHAHLERIVYGLLDKSTEVACYHCGSLK